MINKTAFEMMAANFGLKGDAYIATHNIIAAYEAQKAEQPVRDMFYEHLYEDCQELINPHIMAGFTGKCGEGSLIPSVLESLQFLIEYWVDSGKIAKPNKEISSYD